jgi:glycosyltransferase involved in cell wall biosynthesis
MGQVLGGRDRTLPLVSIIVPIHNRASRLMQAVESVRLQTYPRWELVLVDDGSTDHSGDVIASLAAEDERIVSVIHESNQGAQAARNSGLRAATGDVVAFLDSDDEWLPNSLAIRMATLGGRDDVIVHSDCIRRSKTGDERFFVPPLTGRVYAELLRRPGPLFQTLLAYRDCFEAIDLLDVNIGAYQEWDTCIRLAQLFAFAYVDEPTFIYDVTESDSVFRNSFRSADGYLQVVLKHRREIVRETGARGVSSHLRIIAELHGSAGARLRWMVFWILAILVWPLRFFSIRRRGRESEVLQSPDRASRRTH